MPTVRCPASAPYLNNGQCQNQTGVLPWGTDVAEGRARFVRFEGGHGPTRIYVYETSGLPAPPQVVPGAVPGTLAAQGKLPPPRSIITTGEDSMTTFTLGPGGGGFGGGFPQTPIRWGGTSPISLGGLIGPQLQNACIQYGVPPSICELGVSAVENWLNQGSGGGGGGGGGGAMDCPDGYVMSSDGNCVLDGAGGGGGTDLSPGVTTPAEGAGQATMGRYGVAMIPFTVGEVRSSRGLNPIRRCLPGMVLGKDNLCYDRSALRKSERKWPKPTRPLLTSGEMNAIRKASSAANRLLRTQRRLKKAGRVFGKL